MHEVINEINRMEKLLKNLLNYARPPQPQFDLVDMNQLLGNTLKTAEITAAGKENSSVHFSSDFAPDLPRVEVDSGQMQQVFLNLLLNAVDAIDTEGTITATSRVDEDNNHIRIQVADSGKGISQRCFGKNLQSLFYHQIKRHRTRPVDLQTPDRTARRHHPGGKPGRERHYVFHYFAAGAKKPGVTA